MPGAKPLCAVPKIIVRLPFRIFLTRCANAVWNQGTSCARPRVSTIVVERRRIYLQRISAAVIPGGSPRFVALERAKNPGSLNLPRRQHDSLGTASLVVRARRRGAWLPSLDLARSLRSAALPHANTRPLSVGGLVAHSCTGARQRAMW